MFNKHTKETFLNTFDETSLDITYHHGQTQLQEIKIAYKWATNQYKSRLPTLACQWFNKTDQSMDLIPGVTEESYQPSALDIGTTIYIQMVPESKEMEYIGMPLTKFIGPLSLAPQTEQQVQELLEAQKSTFFVETKSLKLNSLVQSKEGLARQTLLKIVKNRLILMGKLGNADKAEVIKQVIIGRVYPQLILHRKNSKEVTLNFNQQEQGTFLFQGNRIRDVFFLVLQKIKADASQQPQQQQIQEESSLKSETPKNTSVEFTEQEKKSDIKVNSEESFKKEEENLPLSPQTQMSTKQSSAIVKSQIKVADYTVAQLRQNLQQACRAKAKLEEEIQCKARLQKQLECRLDRINSDKSKAEEEACYYKNQSRLLQDDIAKLKQEKQQILLQYGVLAKKLQVSLPQEEAEKRFGSNLKLTFHELLQKMVHQGQEIDEMKNKHSYQAESIERLENEAKIMADDLENSQAQIRKLQKKVESLLESKNILSEQVKTQHTHSHQIGSYEFEIGKLKEQYSILRDSSKNELEAKDKTIQGLKVQVKELIQENTYLRSKDKSSKGQLKNEVVELKKLVNRFAESIAEKDLQIEHLKNTSKQLSKELLRLTSKTQSQ